MGLFSSNRYSSFEGVWEHESRGQQSVGVFLSCGDLLSVRAGTCSHHDTQCEAFILDYLLYSHLSKLFGSPLILKRMNQFIDEQGVV